MSSGTLDPFFMSIIRSPPSPLDLHFCRPRPLALSHSPESICLTCGACSRRRRRLRRRFVTACPSSEGVFARSVLFCKRHSETKGKLITPPPSLRRLGLSASSVSPSAMERVESSANDKIEPLLFSLCSGGLHAQPVQRGHLQRHHHGHRRLRVQGAVAPRKR